MTAPVVSICIPTYNRAPFLESLLEIAHATWRFSFTYEIVVSDNASTDYTAGIVQTYIDRGLPISYYRQSVNKGGGPNCMSAFHRARGTYVMFLGDDDRLVLDGLENAVAVLRDHPDLQAVYAPWELYDDINHRIAGHFYSLDKDQIFVPGQELELLDLVLKRHIFPEHMIYRADVARIILSEPQFCYFAFSHLAHVIARGPVAFIKQSYYRSVIATPIVRDRSRLGHEQAMTDWDVYRGGLEYFVYVVLKRRGVTPTPEGQIEIRKQIDHFIHLRMQVAFRLWRDRKDFVRAYDLAVRLNYLDPAAASRIPDLAELQMLASAQALARFANNMAGISRIAVLGASDIDQLRVMMKTLGLNDEIAVVSGIAAPDEAALQHSVVFLASEADRPEVLALGYPQGLIISQQDLNTGFYLV